VVAGWLIAAPLLAQVPFAGLPLQLQPLVDSGAISGAVMLVADRENILHLSAVGRSSLETGEPMRVDHLFGIASMTKPITAVAVAILVDEGKLSFDDPVEKHLPEFRDVWMAIEETKEPPRCVLVPAPRPITIRDLLTHTSGMRDVSMPDPHWTLSERAKILSRTPLRFAPGTQWSYCSSSFDVLGRIVEVTAGIPFAQFVRQRIFEPLGMRDTGFHLTPEQKGRIAAAYRMQPSTGRLEPFVPPPSFGDPTDCTIPPRPAGGLYATASDMAAFYQMMLNGGVGAGGRILGPETVTEMLRPQTRGIPGNWAGMVWGLGFALVEDPSKVEALSLYSPGSFGHGGSAGTVSFADPGRGLVCIFMIHLVGMPDPLKSPARLAFERGMAEVQRKTP
jgi:CubicO group peptidase (beta-lactamase class C family)